MFYVDSLDELLGMEDISVGHEKVDGKYEITGGYIYDWSELSPDNFTLYSMNIDGTDNKAILTGYILEYITDDKLHLINVKDDSFDSYAADLDGSNLQKYEYEDAVEETVSGAVLNEDVHFGIVVKNNGTAETYVGNRW